MARYKPVDLEKQLLPGGFPKPCITSWRTTLYRLHQFWPSKE